MNPDATRKQFRLDFRIVQEVMVRLLSFFRTLMLALVASLGAIAIGMPVQAAADSLEALHREILGNPRDTEANLRFAQLAEHTGHLRWALAAYERLLINEPDNIEAQRGLQRVRRALQPNFTLATLQFGAIYETNPRYYLPPRRDEVQGFGSLVVLDERRLGEQRWRTNAFAAGVLHQHHGDLNYAVAGFDTGPVLDIFPGWSVHTALGGNAAYFNHRFFYAEAAASATFETNFHGILHTLLLRGAYRWYDDFFPSQEGFYAEARARFAIPNVTGPGSVAIVSPWLLWSDISGRAPVITPIITDLQPGAYLEYGGKFEWVQSITGWLAIGGHISVAQRDYRTDLVVATGDKRRDLIVSPGGSLIFPNLIAYQTDLRLDYRYLTDQSNDPTKDFHDHIASASIVSRFDPTRPWVQQATPVSAR
jgi:hypothetical protein